MPTPIAIEVFPLLASVATPADRWAVLLDGEASATAGPKVINPLEQIYLNWNAPSLWPNQTDLLMWCQHMNAATAAVLVLLGLVFLFIGFSSFRLLVTLNAAVVGGMAGFAIGKNVDGAAAGAIVGALLLGGIAWPLFKLAVAITGGVLGIAVGLSLWRSVGLDPAFCVAGGAIGGVFFGMLSFVSFRPSVMVFTSLQGSMMLVLGLLGLLYKYQSIAPELDQRFALWPALLPLAFFVPALLGSIYQLSTSKPPAEAK